MTVMYAMAEDPVAAPVLEAFVECTLSSCGIYTKGPRNCMKQSLDICEVTEFNAYI
jgi:hypothetical protein